MTSTPNRRQALALLTAGAVGVGTGLYTWRIEPHWLELTHPDLPIHGLPRELDGRTLAQISDIHVGPKVDDDYIVESFQQVENCAPDFVAFTGDWVTYRTASQLDQLRRVLRHAPRGRFGTVGILGNHDYGFGWRMRDVAQEVCAIATSAGITMLRNEAVTMAGLQFIGLDDYWGPYFQPAALLTQKGGDRSTVVLCHNPDAADSPVWADYRGWILAGHTHGGQCKPPFLPPPILPVKNKRYTAGAFELSGGRTMYIGRGVGHLLQARFNVRPEIAVFTLRAI